MRRLFAVGLSLAALAACVLAVGLSAASFSDTSTNPQTVSAIADWVAPSAGASAIVRSQEGAPAGYIKAGGTYHVYANVTDSGNPASGIASVKADVSAITTGQTAVSLTAGSYSAGGASYNYRSAQLTASGTLSAGSKSYSLALADSAGNTRSQGFSVTVYGAFRGEEFETANTSGGTEGKAEKGDTVSFEFNNLPEAKTIVSGWDGSGIKSVTVSLQDNSSNDTMSVSGATIGTVALKGNYTEGTTTFSGSSMSLEGSTVTIVLGTPSGKPVTNSGKTKAVWTPVASILDLAGNASSTTGITGASKKQF